MLAVLRMLAQRVRNVVAECNYAQRRMAVIQRSPDSYLDHPEQAPDTYQALLFRTSGPLAHEPSAAQRAAGRAIR
jgi:hypothetical protein